MVDLVAPHLAYIGPLLAAGGLVFTVRNWRRLWRELAHIRAAISPHLPAEPAQAAYPLVGWGLPEPLAQVSHPGTGGYATPAELRQMGFSTMPEAEVQRREELKRRAQTEPIRCWHPPLGELDRNEVF